MSPAIQFYASSLTILFGINLIAVWGLDLQYGITGIYNFAYIAFQSVGAYTAGLFALHPAAYYQANETYIGGLNMPFPIPLLAAAAAGALLAIPIYFIGIRRLRGDYQAMAMLILSLIATAFANAQQNLVNGPTGIAFVPKPLAAQLPLTLLGYQWVYLAFVAAITLIVFWMMRSIVSSPFGRKLRAVRDSETAAASLGRKVNGARLTVFVFGGALAGLSGGLLILYVSAWSPGSWLYPETFLFLTIIVVGGTANLAGNALGTLLVPILIVEGTRFLPQIGYPGLIDSLDWVVIGLVMLAFLWFRPQGLLPERRRKWVTFLHEGRRSPADVLRLRKAAPLSGDGGTK
jgi:ABC-type branched-subunit amino acid transport system permease subunit